MCYLNHMNSFKPSIPIETLANSADPDQTPQNAASDEGQVFIVWIFYRNF